MGAGDKMRGEKIHERREEDESKEIKNQKKLGEEI